MAFQRSSLHLMMALILVLSLCILLAEIISISWEIPLQETTPPPTFNHVLPWSVPSRNINVSVVAPGKLPKNVVFERDTRYLLVAGWFGRFSNNVNMLFNALVLSKQLNRTLLFSRRSPQGFNIDELFDWELIRAQGYRIEFNRMFHKSHWPESVWGRAKDIHSLDEFIQEYSLDESQLLILHSFTAFYQCVPVDVTQQLWKAFEPSDKYKEMLKVIKREHLGLEEGEEYIGVHLRKMEQECFRMGWHHFNHTFLDHLTNMCTINWTKVSSALDYFEEWNDEGIRRDGLKIFAASDGQDKHRDQDLAQNSVLFVNWTRIPPKQYFPPALDYFLLMDSYVFIGSSISSFSSSISEIRVSKSGKNRNINSLPPIYKEFTVDSFWKCDRYRFWCAKQKFGQHSIC